MPKDKLLKRPMSKSRIKKIFKNVHKEIQYRISVFADPPKEGVGIRFAIYQGSTYRGNTKKNLERMIDIVKQAKKFDAHLLSFPELFLPGYALTQKEAKDLAEFKNGPSITHACKIAKENSMGLILPYAEKAIGAKGEMHYYDSIAVINEKGSLLDSYRKTHLYGQAERNNWDFGDSDYPVHIIKGFPVGVLNCYECEFPELVRILALKGAKLIVGPTAADYYYRMPNGKMTDVPYPDVSQILFPASAYANNLFFAYSNRCGYERNKKDKWHYRGNSIIYGPHGDIIIAAKDEQETILFADLIPAYYTRTHPEPGFSYLRDRRPDLYKKLVSDSAEFINKEGEDLDLDDKLYGNRFYYPHIKNGKEIK